MENVIRGKEINLEETYNGLFINHIKTGNVIQIGCLEDIDILIESLLLLKKSWYESDED